MDDLRLLPEPHERIRCVDFTLRHGVDPGGTAIRADLLIAAETPLPWPKPVFDHPLLVEVPTLVAVAPQPSRVLAAVPRPEAQTLQVVGFRRHVASGGVTRTAWHTDESGLVPTVAALLAGLEPADATPAEDAAPHAEVWVCTQGSHDLCCGAEGTRLVAEIERRWDDVTVRRVSHTGGHRFAPTAVTLPDGRMWAHLDVPFLEAVLRRRGDTAELADRCRGWWGADQGAEQMAERAVFAAEGWVWERAPRWTQIVGEEEGVTSVRVAVGEGELRSFLVRVGVRRDVPTISCRTPGGLPFKPGREYEVLDVEEVTRR